MNAVINAALERSRTTLSALLLILIAGTVAYINIPKESDPDVNIPQIYVSLNHEGISPEDAERLLLRPMEQELRSIEGVKEMRSTAYEGGANIVLEFDAGFDADTALDDVREKVDIAKPDLPEDTDEPTVNEINISLFPVLVVTLSGEVPERVLLHAARETRDAIEGVPTVLEANLSGEREELVEVVVDPIKLESYGLRATEVLEAVSRSNRLIAAGTLDTGTGRFPVKLPGLYETVDDILDQPIKVNGDAVVRIRDIGVVQRSFKDRARYARLNGQPAIGIDVSKRIGTNIIDTIDRVRAVVTEEARNFPPGVQVTFSQDKSDKIEIMLADLQNNVLSAVLLVMIVVVGALGIRSAGLVGVAIPGSFLLGILTLSSLGLTINIVVLFSLILAVGMMVDGAIVVTEFADRKMAEGLPKKDAYAAAAHRMAWPITASTATTLAAFFPLLFWPSIVGEFMKYLPITLLATLAASLLMALVFIPALGAQIGKRSTGNEQDRQQLAASEAGDLDSIGGFTGGYLKVLGAALRAPGVVLLLAVGTLVGVQAYYVFHGNGIEFFPDVEPDVALVNVHARGNLSVDEMRDLVVPVERAVLDAGGYTSVYTTIGKSGQGGRDDKADDVIGTVQIEFADWQDRAPAKEILAAILERTRDLPGIVIETRKQEAGPPTGKAVQIQLQSRDREMLEQAAKITRAHFETMTGLRDIEDTRDVPGIEWRLTVDRAQAAKFGADVSLIGNYVQLVTKGMKITDYRPDDSDEEIDVVVRYPELYRSIEQLDLIQMETADGLIPIGNFVTRTAEPKVGKIRRVDARPAITVKADVLDGVLPNDKVTELRAWLDTDPLPAGVEASFKGEDEEQRNAQAFLLKAFGVALFIMAIILVTQFNSFYSALLILSAVIMSTIGVMIGLLVTGMPFGIVMTGIGVIALAGIVVNNNIVLIDTYDRLRQDGVDAMEAILRTGAQRLRPVLLTTVTTILGLMPMVLQANIDFAARTVTIGAPSTQWWVSLSTAIVFGLGFATVLTLIVTPSALMFKQRLADRWRRWRKLDALDAGKPKLANDGAEHPLPHAAE
ncbi:MAG: efflux RND transporter permease subunit [Alphaproteobacteria bacterium]|nr:efflux RND transporter permease subunit [Alphaproteobacteria bacterium]